MITEQDLIDLHFKRVDLTVEESGDFPFFYYRLKIGDISFIANQIDEGFSVRLFDFYAIEIKELPALQGLITLMKENRVESDEL